jgi:hypothetical protein
VDAHNAITLVGLTAAEVIANHTNDFFFVDPPTASAASMGGSSQAAQLVQAMAGFGGGSGAAGGLNAVAVGPDTSQQTNADDTAAHMMAAGVRRETAALRDFNPPYVGFGSRPPEPVGAAPLPPRRGASVQRGVTLVSASRLQSGRHLAQLH